ncbi:hypothetical protein D3C86_891440 [compost metagenome]
MSISVTIKVYLRPIISPSRPKNNAPKGRTTNPAAKVANVDRKAAVGLSEGKNFVEITMERLPKIKKSYHSMSVPMEEAPMTFQMLFVLLSFINNWFSVMFAYFRNIICII